MRHYDLVLVEEAQAGGAGDRLYKEEQQIEDNMALISRLSGTPTLNSKKTLSKSKKRIDSNAADLAVDLDAAGRGVNPEDKSTPSDAQRRRTFDANKAGVEDTEFMKNKSRRMKSFFRRRKKEPTNQLTYKDLPEPAGSGYALCKLIGKVGWGWLHSFL